ncbi:alpha/beta fold hydrolase [Promicromonospora sp. NPDC057138]|uniref:alpha/beta fold hydrolase n=1 Tax=Promicromonospora sp. NPDC057138 TaxID=3346031 RepID=UPI00362C240A
MRSDSSTGPGGRWSPVRLAENGSVKIAYDQLQGPAGGEPLLLFMGLGVSRHWWPTGFCQALAEEGFRVARFDQRDAGESTHLPPADTSNPFAALLRRRGTAYTAEDMTDDAIAVMDALHWDTAHVFGHSMGGLLAQRAALRHPARVRTLTSSAAVPSDITGLANLRYVNFGTVAKIARKKHPRTRQGNIDAALDLARGIASPAYPFDEAAELERITRLADTGVTDGAAQSRQIGARWSGPKLATLTAPTLVLHGDKDLIVRARAARTIAGSVPGSRLVIYPGVGHDLPEPLWRTVAKDVGALALES